MYVLFDDQGYDGMWFCGLYHTLEQARDAAKDYVRRHDYATHLYAERCEVGAVAEHIKSNRDGVQWLREELLA